MFRSTALLLLALTALAPSSVHADCSDATDCAGCMQETSPTGHQAGCTWFADIDFCEDGCGMEGCGAQQCSDQITTCDECLGQSSAQQYAWSPTDSKCYDSCADGPQDVSCFPGSSYKPEDVCEGPKFCADAKNCGDCMNAESPTGHQAGCTWFADIGYCEDGCQMNGCGAQECADKITTCSECLGQSSARQYAWSPADNSCYESCMDAPADASCFAGDKYGTEVCGDCKGKNISCNKCMGGASKCAWSPASDECVDDCSQAPADAACFPRPNYGTEICESGFSGSSANGGDANAQSTSASSGKLSVAFAIVAAIVGQALPGNYL